MVIPKWLGKCVQPGVEGFFKSWPQKVPSADLLKKCKIVSHRGEHDNRIVFENTLAAFDKILNHGVWGIELDVQWTKDLHPVVIHDADCQRVFGSQLPVNSMALKEINQRFPLIPTLEEIIQRYGRKLHLMVEIKSVGYPAVAVQNKILESLFSDLIPVEDFHIITLDPRLFESINFVPRPAQILVAETNVTLMSEISLAKNYGGITGHYCLLNNSLVQKHRQHNQKIGTGFPSSKNCLYREINRGIEWVFSNNALKLQSICNQHIDSYTSADLDA